MDRHITRIRVTARFKRWGTAEVAARRKEYGRIRKLYQQGRVNTFSLKAKWNTYYYTIRWAKRERWVAFQKDLDEILGDSEWCWTARQNTRPWASSTNSALRDLEGNTVTSVEDKTEIVRKVAFPPPPFDPSRSPLHREGTAYLGIDKSRVGKTLFDQSQKKEPRLDRLNLITLKLLWEWDPSRITPLIPHCVRLGHHPEAWKRAREVLLWKPKKLKYTTVKSYRIISLLHCLGKVYERVVADMLSQWYEINPILH